MTRAIQVKQTQEIFVGHPTIQTIS